jgi:hypothetical protein
MIKATNGEPPREFTVPSDIHFETVDAISGEIAGEWTSNRVKVALRSGQVAAAIPGQPAIQAADEPAILKAGESAATKADKSTITEEDLPPE